MKWKASVPGLGLSSPVIWGDRLFVTTAGREGDVPELKVGLYGDIAPLTENDPLLFQVICLDKNTGNKLWERTAHKGVPKIKRHPKSSHANPSVATDGKCVVAFFGSEGLYCYDVAGKPLWNKDLGLLDSGFFMVPDAQWGFASSPVIHDGKVIVQCDVQKGSFLACFDVTSGNEFWRTPRHDVPTWSTPTVHSTADGVTQVICNGYKEIAGYDLASGKQLWTLGGGGDIPVPTPIVAHDLIFITSAHGPQAPVFAIRTSARGEISLQQGEDANEHIAWSRRRGGTYMQTPIVVGDHLYLCRDNGMLTCLDAKTGEEHYSQRLDGGGFTASAVADGGKLYFTSENGEVQVVKAGPVFELLASNPLGDLSMATPAISDGCIFFRTRSSIIAIAEATPGSDAVPSK